MFPIGSLGNTLPDYIVLKVFKYLELKERVQASTTCRQWRAVYHQPCLWDTVDVKLSSDESSLADRIVAIKHFLTTLGQHIRKLTIDFPEINQLTSRCLAESLHVFLSGLSSLSKGKSQLQEIYINNLIIDQRCHLLDSVRCGLIKTLSDFFLSQPCLEHISLANIYVEECLGSILLKSLSRSPSLQSLHTLSLSYFYNSRHVNVNDNVELVRNLLSSCPKLRQLTINISLLRAVGPDFLFNALKDRLTNLLIVVTDYCDTSFIITEKTYTDFQDSWKLASQLCPRLRVYLYFYGENVDSALVVAGMPLVSVEVSIKGPQPVSDQYGTKISQLFDQLTLCCAQYLETVKVAAVSDSPNRTTLVAESVVALLTTCRNVRWFTVCASLLTPELLISIFQSLRQDTSDPFQLMLMRENQAIAVMNGRE